MKSFCDDTLVTFFGDEIVKTSLKSSKVRFRYNQFESLQFGQIAQLQITNIER